MSTITISILVLLSILLIIILTSVLKLNAFVSLFVISLLLAITALPEHNVVDILKQGFGDTIASIGFLIIFGAIIAVVLDTTRGAVSIANYILSKTGDKKAATAMSVAGFITGMPIFCDSAFIILSGLAKSFSAKASIALPFVAFVLATSLYSVHCLIPTHPGALAAAGILNVNVGHLILFGTVFAVPASITAFYWIKWRTRNQVYEEATMLDNLPIKEEKELPSVFLSFLPIAAPLILIAMASVLNVFDFTGNNLLTDSLLFLGQPIIALLVGVLFSLLLLTNKRVTSLNAVFEIALEKAGPILIVTAAGGMFGLVIKETGIGVAAGEFLLATGLGIAVPFMIAFLLKTAQGSSTVAIITAASFVVPMLPALGLESETGKLLAMLAMGAGSMMISHANDSYFWVVSRFSGVNMNTTLRVYSSATIVMGLTVFLCVFIAARCML